MRPSPPSRSSRPRARRRGCPRTRRATGRFRLGYFPNVTHAQALVGVDDGTFARALGGRLETRMFNAGPAAMEALLAGDLDASYVGAGPGGDRLPALAAARGCASSRARSRAAPCSSCATRAARRTSPASASARRSSGTRRTSRSAPGSARNGLSDQRRAARRRGDAAREPGHPLDVRARRPRRRVGAGAVGRAARRRGGRPDPRRRARRSGRAAASRRRSSSCRARARAAPRRGRGAAPRARRAHAPLGARPGRASRQLANEAYGAAHREAAPATRSCATRFSRLEPTRDPLAPQLAGDGAATRRRSASRPPGDVSGMVDGTLARGGRPPMRSDDRLPALAPRPRARRARPLRRRRRSDRLTWWMEVAPVLLAAAAPRRDAPALPAHAARVRARRDPRRGALPRRPLHLRRGAARVLGAGRCSASRGTPTTGSATSRRGSSPRSSCARCCCAPRRSGRGAGSFVLVTAVALAVSALYELVEWAAALVLGQGADAFLGTQGDPWDTQWDMFLCLVGALLAQLLLARLQDRQLARLAAQAWPARRSAAPRDPPVALRARAPRRRRGALAAPAARTTATAPRRSRARLRRAATSAGPARATAPGSSSPPAREAGLRPRARARALALRVAAAREPPVESPRPGDLAFFHDTYDRNRDGRANDPYTHVALVEAVDGAAVHAAPPRTRAASSASAWTSRGRRTPAANDPVRARRARGEPRALASSPASSSPASARCPAAEPRRGAATRRGPAAAPAASRPAPPAGRCRRGVHPDVAGGPAARHSAVPIAPMP